MATLTATTSPPKRGLHHGIANEQYDALICWLQSTALSGSAACKAIGVTGCERGVGVSSVAKNLAVAAAQNCELPALLIDASGTSHARAARAPMQPTRNGEFSTDSRLEQYVTPSAISNLSLLAIGSMSQAGSLSGRQLTEALNELGGEYGFVVIDLPPADTGLCFAVSGSLSGVLLVVEAGRTNRDTAIRARQRLLQANADVLGIILNKYSHRSAN